jgi:predicted Zn-dependent peptidase
MTYKEYKNESYNLYTIKTDKFKTCHMEIIFYENFDSKLITPMNFLTDMLVHSSFKYPKRQKVVEHLEDLYSASFYGTNARVGNIMLYNYIYDFLDPKYTDKNYLKEVIKFPFEMLFNPNITNDEFDYRSFKIIKSRIASDIASIKESPSRYAIKRALYNMDNRHPASYDFVGNKQDLDDITPETLVKNYHHLLHNTYCAIYLVGNLNMDKINIMINEMFRNNIIKTYPINLFVDSKILKHSQDITEYDNFEQDSLVTIYNVAKLTPFDYDYTMKVFNHIFGNGSLNAKLYQNLREKNSLCYSVNNIYQKYDQLLIIYVGLAAKNKNKAVKLIKKTVLEMQKGAFSENDIQNSKNSILNSIKISLDNPASLVNNYLFHNLANLPLLNEYATEINKVTKQDIQNIAKKMHLNTVYLLAKGDNNARD